MTNTYYKYNIKYVEEYEHVDQNINNQWLESASLELLSTSKLTSEVRSPPNLDTNIPHLSFAWASSVVCLVSAHHVLGSLQSGVRYIRNQL